MIRYLVIVIYNLSIELCSMLDNTAGRSAFKGQREQTSTKMQISDTNKSIKTKQVAISVNLIN